MVESYVGGGSSLFSNVLGDGEEYLYHYTSAETMAKIVESATFRLGPYARTNDPRESASWVSTVTLEGQDANLSAQGTMDLFSKIGDVRDGVKLACFTLDEATERPGRKLPFHRGWARARMWHQYAAQHTGACLIFDKAQWEKGFGGLENGESSVHHGRVKYEDLDLAGFDRLLTFSSKEIQSAGSHDAVRRIVEEHRDVLFLAKNRDWESEREYRYLAFNDADELYLPIADSLVGIVLGQGFPETELAVLGDRLRRNGLSGVRCASLSWRNGAPWVFADTTTTGARLLVLPPVVFEAPR